MDQTIKETKNQEDIAKKTYQSPTLTNCGTLEQQTQTASNPGATNDGVNISS